MSKVKLRNGVLYDIMDYATPNHFVIFLGSASASEVLENMTEENLSEIQFLTDRGAVTGTYRNKLLCGYTDNGDTLAVEIKDVDSGDFPDPTPESSDIPVAPRNTTEGEYIAVNGVLYKAILNIPNGEPIINGKNAVQTTIEEQLFEMTKGE